MARIQREHMKNAKLNEETVLMSERIDGRTTEDIAENSPPPSGTYMQPICKLRLLITSLCILTISNLPQALVAAGEPDCGINRFNNESPLTERIVGGNNSLQ